MTRFIAYASSSDHKVSLVGGRHWLKIQYPLDCVHVSRCAPIHVCLTIEQLFTSIYMISSLPWANYLSDRGKQPLSSQPKLNRCTPTDMYTVQIILDFWPMMTFYEEYFMICWWIVCLETHHLHLKKKSQGGLKNVSLSIYMMIDNYIPLLELIK